MRRLKRHANFDITIDVKSDDFIRPPRDAQRNWLVNGALNEFAQNLLALDGLAARFVPGAQVMATQDRTQAILNDQEIMEDWQVPLMQAMADVATENHGDLLEIGFGRGVSSSFIQERGVRSHTIIECNDDVVQRYEDWRQQYPDAKFTLAHGKWQDVLCNLGLFDSIFFHTYPLNEEELVEQIGTSTTFADHFFSHAAEHLKPGGVFTYLSNEIDSLGRGHQRLLLEHFSSITLQVVHNLAIPVDVHDSWWADSMVIVKAVK